ncbi:hypothetical protein CTRI78_v004327 [Colletotrichum trifolii]|uniref:Secreted effector NIS1 n=1 Tax=Colletotrichum trifolii TaxID=5466 RepID=A0A4R8RLX1_COLTR|nr:hypothetical protein CTRI78_v004327 [Colletotrichum trifolii]
MQFLTSLAAAASLVSLASARISGIALPRTVKAGDNINAIVVTEGYIQSVQDIAIAFGVAPAASAYPGTLSTLLGSFYLGPEQSNVPNNITEPITIPESLVPGKYVIAASLFSLYGASSSPTVSNYNVTVNVGNETSTTYVRSQFYVGNSNSTVCLGGYTRRI